MHKGEKISESEQMIGKYAKRGESVPKILESVRKSTKTWERMILESIRKHAKTWVSGQKVEKVLFKHAKTWESTKYAKS